MAQFSRLNGPLPVQPPSGGVIRARKKSRPEDRNRENKKKSSKENDEKQVQESENVHIKETKKESENRDAYDEPVEYGPSKSKKKYSRKIDLII